MHLLLDSIFQVLYKDSVLVSLIGNGRENGHVDEPISASGGPLVVWSGERTVRDEHLYILDASARLCVHWLLCQLSVHSRQNEQDNIAQAATPAKPSRRLARKGTGARGVMDRQKPDPVHYDMHSLSMHSGIEVSGSGVRRTIGDGPQQEQQVNEERSEATN